MATFERSYYVSVDSVYQMISVATSIVGAVGGLSAFITYKKNQALKRQEILFPLINEFESKMNIIYAKKPVDQIPIQLENQNGEILGNYEKKHMEFLTSSNQSDKNVIAIKLIFDTYLNFFGKLGYLIDTHILTKHDVRYFDYYIMNARNDFNIMYYAVWARYDLFLVLLDKAGYIGDVWMGPIGGDIEAATQLTSIMISNLKSYYKRTRRKFL